MNTKKAADRLDPRLFAYEKSPILPSSLPML